MFRCCGFGINSLLMDLKKEALLETCPIYNRLEKYSLQKKDAIISVLQSEGIPPNINGFVGL